MIPEKVTKVRFPSKISAVHSKLLPINDLVFQFLIKHLDICYKFSYKMSDQKIGLAILYIISATFLRFFVLLC